MLECLRVWVEKESKAYIVLDRFLKGIALHSFSKARSGRGIVENPKPSNIIPKPNDLDLRALCL